MPEKKTYKKLNALLAKAEYEMSNFKEFLSADADIMQF